MLMGKEFTTSQPIVVLTQKLKNLTDMESNVVNQAAVRYMQDNGLGVIKGCIGMHGVTYFHLDYSNHARYTGHPCVIAVNSRGEVARLRDIMTIYPIVRKIKELSQST